MSGPVRAGLRCPCRFGRSVPAEDLLAVGRVGRPAGAHVADHLPSSRAPAARPWVVPSVAATGNGAPGRRSGGDGDVRSGWRHGRRRGRRGDCRRGRRDDCRRGRRWRGEGRRGGGRRGGGRWRGQSGGYVAHRDGNRGSGRSRRRAGPGGQSHPGRQPGQHQHQQCRRRTGDEEAGGSPWCRSDGAVRRSGRGSRRARGSRGRISGVVGPWVSGAESTRSPPGSAPPPPGAGSS